MLIYIFNAIYKDVQAMYVPNMLQFYNLEEEINKKNYIYIYVLEKTKYDNNNLKKFQTCHIQ